MLFHTQAVMTGSLTQSLVEDITIIQFVLARNCNWSSELMYYV